MFENKRRKEAGSLIILHLGSTVCLLSIRCFFLLNFRFFWVSCTEGRYSAATTSPIGNIGCILSVLVDPHQMHLEQRQACCLCEIGLGNCFRPGWGIEHVGPVITLIYARSFTMRVFWIMLVLIDGLSWSAKFLIWTPIMRNNLDLNLEIQFCIHLGPFILCFDGNVFLTMNMDDELFWCKRTNEIIAGYFSHIFLLRQMSFHIFTKMCLCRPDV